MEGHFAGQDRDYTLDGKGKYHFSKKLVPFVGPSSDFDLLAKISDQEEGFSVPLLNLDLKSPYLLADLRGALGERGSPFSLEKTDLVLTGTLPWQEGREYFNTAGFYAHFDGATREIQAAVELDGSDREIRSGNIQFKVENAIQEGKLALDATKIAFVADVEVGSPLICQLLGQGNLPCEILLGKRIYLETIGSRENGKTDLTLKARGEGLEADLALAVLPNFEVQGCAPGKISWQLTSMRLEAIENLAGRGRDRYSLARESEVQIDLSNLSFRLTESLSRVEALKSLVFDASLKASPIVLSDVLLQKQLTLNNLSLSLKTPALMEKVEGVFETHFIADVIPSGIDSKVNIAFALNRVLSSEGSWLAPSALSVQAFSDHLPVKEVSVLLIQDDELRSSVDALLGELLNSIIQIGVAGDQGDFNLDLKATNFKAYLPLHYNQGFLTLTRPIEAELTLTQEINAIFLKDLNPLFITGAYSRTPIRLFIQQEGFLLPIRPFRIDQMRIEKGSLDLGQIEVRNGGQVHLLMEFLKAEKLSQEQLMQAWFTPIYFSLERGVLSCSRFDVLLGGSVHIAFWGSINLAADRVQMVLGISPKNLKRRFNVSGLAKKDMFQVKMNGSTSNLELDWSSAYTRLGILFARTAGGHIGNIVGGIVESLVETFSDQEPSPPPSTQPFPWEVGLPPQAISSLALPDETSPP